MNNNSLIMLLLDGIDLLNSWSELPTRSKSIFGQLAALWENLLMEIPCSLGKI